MKPRIKTNEFAKHAVLKMEKVRSVHRVNEPFKDAVFYADHSHTTLLLAFEDVTERRAIEREKEEL
jgi:hypothetical protein